MVEGGKRGAPGSWTTSSALKSSGVLGRSVLSCRRNAEGRTKSRRCSPVSRQTSTVAQLRLWDRCAHPASAAHTSVAHSPDLHSGKCTAVGTSCKYHALLSITLSISVAQPKDVALLTDCLHLLGSLGFFGSGGSLEQGKTFCPDSGNKVRFYCTDNIS